MKRNSWRLWAAAAVAAAAVLAHGGTLVHGFTWDDHDYLVGNAFLRSPLQALREHSVILNAARPVWVLSAMADMAVWGARPLGHHLTSLLLHIGNAWLVLALARAAGVSRRGALLAGLLLAVHPLATEPVCAATFRPDLLAGMGIALAMLCLIRWTQTRRTGWLAGLGAATVFALGAKESAVAIPVLAAWTLWLFGKRRVRSWWPVAPTVALVLGAFLLRARWSFYRVPLLGGQEAQAPVETLARWNGSAPAGAWAIPLSLGHLLERILWPLGVGIDPRFPGTGALRVWQVLLLLVTGVAAWRLRAGLACWALGWMVIAALPSANLLPMPNVVADRYAYIPLMSVCLAAGIWMGERFRVRLFWPLTLLAVACLASQSNGTAWASDSVLWERAVRSAPHSARARMNAGAVRSGLGRFSPAERYLNQARALAPDYPWPVAHLARVAESRGDFRKAAGLYDTALGMLPRPNRELALAAGDAHWRVGDRDRAIALWRSCWRESPEYAAAGERLKGAGVAP